MKISLMTTIKIMIASTLLCASAAVAQDKCIPKEDYDAVLGKYTIEIYSGGVYMDLFEPGDRCKNDLYSTYLKGIIFLNKLTRFKNTPSEYQTLISKEGPLSFFDKRVKTIQFENEENSTCIAEVAAYVDPTETQDKVMHFCSSERADLTTPLSISHTMVHEARHIDGYHHVRCQRGNSAELGLFACDNNYEEQGAHGIGTGYLLYVYFGTKNDALKDEARTLAVNRILTGFNKPPLNVKPGALLLGSDSVYFHDGTLYYVSEYDTEIKAVEGKNSLYYYFRDGDVAFYKHDREDHFVQGPSAIFWSKLSQSERDSLIDAKSTPSLDCFLWARYMRCFDYKANKLIEKRFTQIAPLRFFEREMLDAHHIQILDRNGQIYTLPNDASKIMSTSDRDFEVRTTQYPNLLGWVTLEDGRQMGLSKSGSLLIKNGSKWIQEEESIGIKFKKILPFQWSLYLEQL